MNDQLQFINGQTMRRASFFYWFLLLSSVFVFGAGVIMADRSNLHWLPDFLGFIHLVVSVVFVIGSFVGSQRIAAMVFARADLIENSVKLNEFYVMWVFIRLSMAALASLISSIGFLLTSNLMLLAVAILMVVSLFGFRPSQAKATALINRAGKSCHDRNRPRPNHAGCSELT
jgi:hypothetical protein